MKTHSDLVLPGTSRGSSIGGLNLPPSGVEVFDNQVALIKASEFCSRYGYSMKTIYEWKYRPRRNKVPDGLVVKFRGRLFIRLDILRNLIPFGRSPLETVRKED